MSEIAEAVVEEVKPKPSPPAKSAALMKAEEKKQTANNTDELGLIDAAQMLVKSGLVRTGEDLGKIVAKISFGRGIGLADVTSLNGINFSPNGTLVLSASLMLGLIKRSGKYRMQYVERNDDIVSIKVWERFGDEWFDLGVPVSFSWKDAERAGLATKETYKKYRRQMLTARAISDVFKVHCTDVVGGQQVYTPEEIDGSGFRTDPETLEMIPDAEVVDVKPAKSKSAKSNPIRTTVLVSHSEDAAVTNRFEEIEELLAKTNSDRTEFLSYFKVDSVFDLSLSAQTKAISLLQTKSKAMPKS